MESKVKDEQINEYISGELTGNDLVEFEKLLAKDVALQQQIKEHQQIDGLLMENYFEVNQFNQADYEREKARLGPIFEKMREQYFSEEIDQEKKIITKETETTKQENQSKTIIRRLLPVVTLAAAAALLLFVFNPNSTTVNLSPDQLADQYYETYSSTLRSEAQLVDTPDILLAKGSTQYEIGQIDQAIQTFQQVKKNGSLIYQNEANWYLVLCYLKQDKPEMAKPLLSQLQQSADYGKKAKEILKQLE